MKEVWGVLEVVREQCWLNKTLRGCNWVTEGLTTKKEEVDESSVTDADLQAALHSK